MQHNELCNTVHREASKANFRPELERSGLLANLGWPGVAGRRPADTLLVGGAALSVTSRRRLPKVALDFAVVSPFAVGAIRDASREVLATTKAYSERKRAHNNTQRMCEEANIGFEPIVFEATGGLESEGAKVLTSIFAEVAKSTGKVKADVVRRLKGRISIDFCRAQSRALRRRRMQVDHTRGQNVSIADQVALQSVLEHPPDSFDV